MSGLDPNGPRLAASEQAASTNTAALVLGSATVELVGSGSAFGAYTFPIATGKTATVRRYTLAPGQVISWGPRPGTVVAIVTAGEATNYLSCKLKQNWKPDHSYFLARSKAAGTLSGITVNESNAPAEILAVISAVAGPAQRPDQLHMEAGKPEDAPLAAIGCPSGAPATSTDLGSGRVTGNGDFAQDDHQLVTIYSYALAPGYSSGWLYLTDPGFLVQTKGTVEIWRDCTNKVRREAGTTYLNDAIDESERFVNSSSSQAEFLVVGLNVSSVYPLELGPAFPELPPSDCPQTAFPS